MSKYCVHQFGNERTVCLQPVWIGGGIQNYPGVALLVLRVSIAVECHVVAVSAGIKPADDVARAIGVRRRPMRITRALSKIVSGAAVSWHVVVASTAQEVTVENRVARGYVIEGRVVFIAFAVNEILADS